MTVKVERLLMFVMYLHLFWHWLYLFLHVSLTDYSELSVGWGQWPLVHHAVCLVAQLCPTLCYSRDCSPPGSSVHRDSPSKNTEVGCHVLLQGIFPTQGLNPGLLHCRQIPYNLSHQRSPLPIIICCKSLPTYTHSSQILFSGLVSGYMGITWKIFQCSHANYIY